MQRERERKREQVSLYEMEMNTSINDYSQREKFSCKITRKPSINSYTISLNISAESKEDNSMCNRK